MIKRIFKFFGKILLWFFAMSIIWVALLKFIPVYITPLMVIRYFENNEQNKWTHKWVPLKDISKKLVQYAINNKHSSDNVSVIIVLLNYNI